VLTPLPDDDPEDSGDHDDSAADHGAWRAV